MDSIVANPKTSEYLLKQDWRGKMIDNMIKYGFSPKEILGYLLGTKGPGTLGLGFRWKSTPEGYDYWNDIDTDLMGTACDEEWNDSYVRIKLD